MKVILTKDVQNLGSAGDIKEVSDGYARNFLIPGGYVKSATVASVKRAEEIKKEKELLREQELGKLQEIAEKMEGVSVEIKAKADDSGKLYAAIKQEDILDALGKKGFNVKKGTIVINEPLKEVGEKEVVLSLDHGLEVRVGVKIEAEK